MNYDYPDDEHRRWKLAATHKGQTLKDWIEQALNEVAERQARDRAEDERKRRGR